ncbi:hypothetical protein AKO1_012315 [Acrasis kona]|uniref:PH domain-containing protein n=1 Tax=Acrasis kona TaxID=1008807 RepID=A0AAW2YXA0_9EUKA
MYTKKAGKLYDVSGTTKEKCIVKLKRRHITSRIDDPQNLSETDFKLTPFTAAVVSELSAKSNRTGPTAFIVNEIQQNMNSQECLRSLRFVCATYADAEDWCKRLQYNVVTLTQAVLETKITRSNKKNVQPEEDMENGMPTHRNIQDELIEKVLSSNIDNKRKAISCCGYLIRRNHSQQRSFRHHQVYRKPSQVFGVLYTTGEVEFHQSHDMNKIADVIACRVDLLNEKVKITNVEGSQISFALTVGDETRELFVCSDIKQKQLWMQSLQSITSADDTQDKPQTAPTEQSPPERKPLDPELAKALGLELYDTDDSDDDDGGTWVKHDSKQQQSEVVRNNAEFDIGLGSDDDGEGSVIVHNDNQKKEKFLEEPNIFGKNRSDIFQNDFWSQTPDAKQTVPIPAPKKVEPTELEKALKTIKDRDEEIMELKQMLEWSKQKLEASESENRRLLSLLETKLKK